MLSIEIVSGGEPASRQNFLLHIQQEWAQESPVHTSAFRRSHPLGKIMLMVLSPDTINQIDDWLQRVATVMAVIRAMQGIPHHGRVSEIGLIPAALGIQVHFLIILLY